MVRCPGEDLWVWSLVGTAMTGKPSDMGGGISWTDLFATTAPRAPPRNLRGCSAPYAPSAKNLSAGGSVNVRREPMAIRMP